MNERASDQKHTDDWNEYRRAILGQLDEISNDIENVNQKVDNIRTVDLVQIRIDIALLKFQAAMWGALSGLVVGSIITLVAKAVLKW